ncbi:DUF2971 domain-containing protein [Vibrio cholerae]|uniref:DUF2971 domain-containing protein n=1 Tax=Vibrio cholerae TaxID=666 RepID=UPI000E0B7A79|nr:DUF2971 domain-containing protein [Vibrio cholerae]EJL6604525.1 DUF2971 domain-containing protein [Vibrio cholerae]EJL6622679.1 DUF2971 domain-containing protein [Vibrio cholerae]EJL6823980.1 DUF2971 domain-containing protein [Vibrio cholerae]EKF9419210.1 DUF2971 domain-containing protein [Vibrio cholerae]HAS3612840.1 DUF2971 domain-containing protein [Vibrio cholerae]
MINQNSVYKFFPYNPHDLDTLANNYLWFSRFSDFNDPFEDVFIENVLDSEIPPYNELEAIKLLKLVNQGSGSPIQVERSLTKLAINGQLRAKYEYALSSTIEHARKLFADYVENSRLCCFAQDDIECEASALQNKLMWSHYSNGMRGYCVEFDRIALIESIHQGVGHVVGYTEMLYGNLVKQSHHSILHQTVLGMFENKSGVGIGDLVTMKSSEWAYEKEFRLQVKNVNMVKFNPKCILSVTVGFKMPESKLMTLQSVLRGNDGIDCPVFRASINSKTFGIEREQIGKTK